MTAAHFLAYQSFQTLPARHNPAWGEFADLKEPRHGSKVNRFTRGQASRKSQASKTIFLIYWGTLFPGGDTLTDKPVTIRDVAKLAGVSPATVSNVLGGRKPVSEEVAERVRKATRDLKYEVDRAASQLRGGKTKVIAVLVPDLDNPYFTEVVSAIENCLSRENYDVIVASARGKEAVQNSRLAASLAWRPAGVVMIPCTDNFTGGAQLERAKVPYVLADRVAEDLAADTISVDNEKAAATAARYLVDQGHSNILVAASTLHLANIRQRCAGAIQAVQEYGLPAPVVVETGGSFETATEVLGQWLDSHQHPTAILALTNFTTLGVLAALAERGIRIPQQISLIGFDDYAWMRARATPLTAIRQPVAEMAGAIWERLSRRIHGDVSPARHIRLECDLQIRASVSALSQSAAPPGLEPAAASPPASLVQARATPRKTSG